jgi:hypothetical protein
VKRIDLCPYADTDVRVLSGRDRGLAVRLELRLDELDTSTDEKVQLVVPETVRHVNSSFFLGLIGASVQMLGREKFSRKYEIKALPRVQMRFQQAVDRVMLRTAPLP